MKLRAVVATIDSSSTYKQLLFGHNKCWYLFAEVILKCSFIYYFYKVYVFSSTNIYLLFKCARIIEKKEK
jgi:hypothetical protein